MTLLTIRFRKLFLWLLAVACVCFTWSCSEKDNPAPAAEDNLIEAAATGYRSAAELQALVQLSGRNIDPALFAYDVDIYNVVYTTTYQDQTVEASGLVLLPKTTNGIPMISYQHGTIVQQADAPSMQSKNDLKVISYAAMASMGFITVVPDLLGFGESNEIFHPYYVEEPTTAAVTDLLRAAATLVEEKEMTFDGRLFLAGYSQGGYATLATHKALESTPEEGFDLIASFSGAGGYDIGAMQEYFFSLETYSSPYYIAYVGMSYQTHYEKADLLENFFNAPYAGLIPGLFDGLKSAGEINAQLTSDMDALVKADVLNNTGANDVSTFLYEKFQENSLTDWAPSLPVFLYHGDADMTVPLQNSTHTYEVLLDNGAAPENLQLIVLPGKDHSTSVEPFIEDVMQKLQDLK